MVHGLASGKGSAKINAVQLAIDTLIVAAAFAVVDPPRVGYSVLGALVLNLVLVCNHRPGRYAAG